LYEYVAGNPNSGTDPSGLVCVECSCSWSRQSPSGGKVKVNCTGLGTQCCYAACRKMNSGMSSWKICDAVPDPPDETDSCRDWETSCGYNCWTCCLQAYSPGARISVLAGSVGCRIPKTNYTPTQQLLGKPRTKSIWSQKCCRDALRYNVKTGIWIGRIGTGLILIEGAYSAGAMCYCASICGG